MVARRAAALSVCAVVLCGCGGKAARPPPAKVLAHKAVTGTHASATASGAPGLLSAFSVRVRATPNQRITGGWVVSCRVGTATSRDSKNFAGRTPLTIPIPIPTASDLSGCTIVATASLARSGRVTVGVLGG